MELIRKASSVMFVFECTVITFYLWYCFVSFYILTYVGAAQFGPGIVVAHPGQTVELLCNLTGLTNWIVNGQRHTLNELVNGSLPGHSINGTNIIVEDIVINDPRNGSKYICVLPQLPPLTEIRSDPTNLYVTGEYKTLCIL